MKLIPGTTYRVRYKEEQQKYPREFIAVFLAYHDEDTVWSGRPVFGTTTLPASWFIHAETTGLSPRDVKVIRP